MAKKRNTIEAYKRFETIIVGTENEVMECYEDIIGWEFEMNFGAISDLKIGEKKTDITCINFIIKKGENVFKLCSLTKETLEKEGFPNIKIQNI